MERPEPAVGQVWRTSDGSRYWIQKDPYEFWFNRVYESGDKSTGYSSPSVCVTMSDVYVGQFGGFRVNETT